ncbi:hypothetical protein KC360_g7 [Hortaea werneckii]|nr:hypothetical protein KC344_g7 [Hortaea werneckii]KAI7180374.1 hypothetical protein KC360_g7 [Hortaea werneckii]
MCQWPYLSLLREIRQSSKPECCGYPSTSSKVQSKLTNADASAPAPLEVLRSEHRNLTSCLWLDWNRPSLLRT